MVYSVSRVRVSMFKKTNETPDPKANPTVKKYKSMKNKKK